MLSTPTIENDFVQIFNDDAEIASYLKEIQDPDYPSRSILESIELAGYGGNYCLAFFHDGYIQGIHKFGKVDDSGLLLIRCLPENSRLMMDFLWGELGRLNHDPLLATLYAQVVLLSFRLRKH